jgi:hypothetical protein
LFAEVGSDRPGYGRIAPEIAVTDFARTPGGAELVREWGAHAGRYLGVVEARLSAIGERLDDAGRRAMFDWFDGLPRGAQTAIFRAMVR